MVMIIIFIIREWINSLLVIALSKGPSHASIYTRYLVTIYRHLQCEKYLARHWNCRYELVLAPSFKAAHSQRVDVSQTDLGKHKTSPKKRTQNKNA